MPRENKVSRQLEQTIEERAARERAALLRNIYGGLEAAVEHVGGELTGISVTYRGDSVLMTVRAQFPAGKRVCFVGSDDLGATFAKCGREVQSGRARWKEDKWRVNVE